VPAIGDKVFAFYRRLRVRFQLDFNKWHQNWAKQSEISIILILISIIYYKLVLFARNCLVKMAYSTQNPILYVFQPFLKKRR